MFNSQSIEEAREKRDAGISGYSGKHNGLPGWGFRELYDRGMLPARLYRYYRTSNTVERLNRELKHRSKVIDVFPYEASVLRLMGSVLIEQNDRSQGGR